jgi:hypothetical protein
MVIILVAPATHPFTSEEFSDESFSDAGSSGNDSEPDLPVSSDERPIAEQQLAMDKLVPALEPSEYGKMPPTYHSNSQRVAPPTFPSDTSRETAKLEASDKGTNPETKPVRLPILPRDKYDGVDSDDESDIEDDGSEEEEERPQVVGEIEIDMQEEEEEFIEFSRQVLGISDAQWAEIVKDRKERGGMSCL